jgi:hypothetical protein
MDEIKRRLATRNPVRLLLYTSFMSVVPHAVLNLGAAQAEVFEHAIVHCRKPPYVATDAQFIGNRGDQPRQLVRRRQIEVKDRPWSRGRERATEVSHMADSRERAPGRN